MNTTESLGYLKGLLDGLDFDADKKDTKMFKAIVEVLENIIKDIDDVNEDMDLLAEQVDGIDDDLAEVEDYLAECDECDCEDCEDCEDGEYAVTPPAAKNSLWMKIPLWKAESNALPAASFLNLNWMAMIRKQKTIQKNKRSACRICKGKRRLKRRLFI